MNDVKKRMNAMEALNEAEGNLRRANERLVKDTADIQNIINIQKARMGTAQAEVRKAEESFDFALANLRALLPVREEEEDSGPTIFDEMRDVTAPLVSGRERF